MNARNRVKEDIGTTLAIGVGAWGAAVAAGTAAGVFAKLPFELVVALSAFGSIFALGVVMLDPLVRAFVAQARATPLAAILLAALAAADLALTRWDERLASFPHALVLLFVLPLALAAAAALFEREALRSRAAKSPAATRAAC